VKATCGMWTTQAERNAIATVLSSWPPQPLPPGVVVTVPAVQSSAAPVSSADPTRAPSAPTRAPAPARLPRPLRPLLLRWPWPVYYKNCTEARAAGAAPVHRGDPGYGSHLDRDGCEN
jgi:hypothetical protein